MGATGGGEEWRSTRIMYHQTGDIMNDPCNWQTVKDRIIVEDPLEELTTWRGPRLQFNSQTCWIYEGIYFALMDVYTMDRPNMFDGWDYITRHNEDYMNFYIGTSRDGLNFDKSWIHNREPLVPRGEEGNWDKDGIKPPSQILTVGDEHWIYYGGMSERHYSLGRDLKIGLAKLPLDRFIAWEAKAKLGTLVTKPFKLEGDTLQVNIDARAGRIYFEVLDAEGKSIPGYTVRHSKIYNDVDELRLKPQWKNNKDLSKLIGKVIRIKFYLHNAKLYAFQIQ